MPLSTIEYLHSHNSTIKDVLTGIVAHVNESFIQIILLQRIHEEKNPSLFFWLSVTREEKIYIALEDSPVYSWFGRYMNHCSFK